MSKTYGKRSKALGRMLITVVEDIRGGIEGGSLKGPEVANLPQGVTAHHQRGVTLPPQTPIIGFNNVPLSLTSSTPYY
eukprot:1723788-Pyramimonas_sp.AAC.1